MIFLGKSLDKFSIKGYNEWRIKMNSKWIKSEDKIKNVKLICYMHGGNSSIYNNPTIATSIDCLKNIAGRVNIVNIDINYTNKENKKVNCDSIVKAISWLNLNDKK